MRLGICMAIENLIEAHAAGFDYVEISAPHLLPDAGEADFACYRARALSSPLGVESCNCFLPAQHRVVGPEVDLHAVGVYMEIVLRRLAEVGGKVMVFGSGGARHIPDGFPFEEARSQFCAAAQLAGAIAARYDVIIALEPLAFSECNLLNRVEDAMALVVRINHPHVRVLADSYHMLAVGESFESIPIAGSLLAHVHVDMPDLAAYQSGVPSPFPAFFAALRQAGYTGRVSIENHSFTPEEGHAMGEYLAAARVYLVGFLATTQ